MFMQQQMQQFQQQQMMMQQQQNQSNMAAMTGMNPQQQQILLQQQMLRNQAMLEQQQAQQAQPQIDASGAKDVHWLRANLDEFNSYVSAEKKNILGTMMYAKVVEKASHSLVPKITGMLIDLNVLAVDDIIDSIQNRGILQQRVNEAIQLIQV